MINKEIIIKHFDILLDNIDDITQFDINGIMTKYGDFKHDITEQNMQFRQICESVKRFGKTYKYFDFEEKRPTIYFLKENGIKAKEIGGHLKFQESLNKTPLTLYQKIQLPFFILSVLSAIIFGGLSYRLNNKTNELVKQKSDLNDTIKKLSKQIEIYKSKSLNDTSQTKSLNDLKTD